MRWILKTLLDFIFPPKCLHCKTLLFDSRHFCESCISFLYAPILQPLENPGWLHSCKMILGFEPLGPIFSLYQEVEHPKLLQLFVDILLCVLDEAGLSGVDCILHASYKKLPAQKDAVKNIAEELAKRWDVPYCSIKKIDLAEYKKCLLLLQNIPAKSEAKDIYYRLKGGEPSKCDIFVLFGKKT